MYHVPGCVHVCIATAWLIEIYIDRSCRSLKAYIISIIYASAHRRGGTAVASVWQREARNWFTLMPEHTGGRYNMYTLNLILSHKHTRIYTHINTLCTVPKVRVNIKQKGLHLGLLTSCNIPHTHY